MVEDSAICWMFDMVKNKWSKSDLSIPRPGKYHAILIQGKTNDDDDFIELFQYGHPSDANGTHFSISLPVLLKSMRSIDKLPERETTKQFDQNHKIYSINKNKYTELSINELKNEILNNKDLSKSKRKKMLKKLKKKQMKYNKPLVPQKEENKETEKQSENQNTDENIGSTGETPIEVDPKKVIDNNRDNCHRKAYSVKKVFYRFIYLCLLYFFYDFFFDQIFSLVWL